MSIGEEKQDSSSNVYFSGTGSVTTPVFFLQNLRPGSSIQGPAMIIDKTQTIVVELQDLEAAVLCEERHHWIYGSSTKRIIAEVYLDQRGFVD